MVVGLTWNQVRTPPTFLISYREAESWKKLEGSFPLLDTHRIYIAEINISGILQAQRFYIYKEWRPRL